MEDIANILDWIKENNEINLSLSNFVEENPVYSAERVGDSVLVRGISDHPWVYIDSNSEEELQQLALGINSQDKYFAAIEDWMLPLVLKDRTPSWRIKTYQYILPVDIDIPEPEHDTFPLSPNDADYIFTNSNYKNILSSSYIKERIMKGYSAGLKENGKLVAWILTHDDGAIGSLHVIKEYRHKGYAHSVVVALLHKLRDEGKKPFLYIDDPNKAAADLLRGLGFVRKTHVNWVEID
ncbi:MAG TPA: GNAT family N-acetyltransferase [Victivallales bacterium]|nr:GNAT family N-acetyltransferase [Victivallales bacterium]